MFTPGEKVRSGLGAEGSVERITKNKDGQLTVYIKWRTGATGAYTIEEIKRYGIRKIPA